MYTHILINGISPEKALAGKLSEMMAKSKQVLSKHALEATIRFRNAAPKGVSHRLAMSIFWSVEKETPTDLQIKIRAGQGIGYARFVEFGTVTNKWRKMPPVGPGSNFAQWAAAKGINPWALANFIAKKRMASSKPYATAKSFEFTGVKAHPFLYREWQYTPGAALKDMEAAAADVAGNEALVTSTGWKTDA